jgi:regulator of protease activity HflC (stomatin/prohibitin superfamily)
MLEVTSMRMRLLSVLSLVFLCACGKTIAPGQSGLLYRALRTPAFSPKQLPPGRYALWWWNDIVIYDVTSTNRDEVVHVLTRDNLALPVTVTATFHVQQPDIYNIHTRIGPNYYDKLIGPAFITLTRAEFSKHLHNDLASESPQIEQTVREKLSAIAAKYNIEIDQIAIRHIDYDDTVTSAISRKIATRQQAEQKEFEVQIAKRDADIVRAGAQGRADATRIQAEADAAAIVMRGEAQAKAQDKIGETLTPRYLQFRAFDTREGNFFFWPQGKDGMPIIVQPQTTKK